MADPLSNDSSPVVGLVFDDRYLQHDPGLETHWGSGESYPFVDPILHASNYRLVFRSKHLIDLWGLGKDLVRIDAYPATDEQIAYYHLPGYIQLVKDTAANGGGDVGRGTPIAENGYEIALLSTGGCLAAVDAVVGGRVERAFANVRPPGHHATAEAGMGYCVFNNAAVASRHAQRAHGIRKVLVLDWDVHPGNGTQAAFYDDPDVLFVSLHQQGIFAPPFACEPEEVGEGPGAGFNVNVALPPGSGDAVYLAAFERIVVPIADAFAPELIIVSAGQDASISDPLGRQSLTTEGYRSMTTAMVGLAGRHAGGRLVVLQEGGYSEIYGPYCTVAIVETLMGRRVGRSEPLGPEYTLTRPETTTVGPSGKAALDRIAAALAPYWPALAEGAAG